MTRHPYKKHESGTRWCALDDSYWEFPTSCKELIRCNPNTDIGPKEVGQPKTWLTMQGYMPDNDSPKRSKIPSTESQLVAQKNIGHYEEHAASYYEGTKDHDISQNIDTLLRAITAPAPCTILDFGCGPGRDLQTFTKLGHRAVGLEGSSEAARIARSISGCEVLVQDFFNLDLPVESFDGVFANAALFHIPKEVLPQVLSDLWSCLKPGGILFSSNPRGNNEAHWFGERFGLYHDLEGWRTYMSQAHFIEIEHYYRPSGLPFEQQPWLASVWKKALSARY